MPGHRAFCTTGGALHDRPPSASPRELQQMARNRPRRTTFGADFEAPTSPRAPYLRSDGLTQDATIGAILPVNLAAFSLEWVRMTEMGDLTGRHPIHPSPRVGRPKALGNGGLGRSGTIPAKGGVQRK